MMIKQSAFKALTPQQHRSTQRGPDGICKQVIPTCTATRKVHLMQLIEPSRQQSAPKGQYQHGPATQTTGATNGPRQHREYSRMHDLVPRRGDQAHRHGLRTTQKQTQQQGNSQQRSYQS